jgi:hypothetical protein
MNIIPSLFRVSPHVFYTVLSHCEAVISTRDRSRARRILRERKFINPSYSRVKSTAKSTTPPAGQSECADGANREAV